MTSITNLNNEFILSIDINLRFKLSAITSKKMLKKLLQLLIYILIHNSKNL
jgi:hypothetical protein